MKPYSGQRNSSMAHRAKVHKQNAGKITSLKQFYVSYVNYDYLKKLLVDPSHFLPTFCFLLFVEVFINLIIVNYVKYTEIDWKAYMQEVEGVLKGTYDYSLLKGNLNSCIFTPRIIIFEIVQYLYDASGDTGPLVYPAGFVWIFSGLYFVTGKGENIVLAQYIFALLYLINLFLVLRIYLRAKKLPPYVLILTCLTSYRIHSIFALRLFNDPIAMILLYASINSFIDSKWNLGSVLFSLAVSVKMNVLLFAPALLLAYLTCIGLKETFKQLGICAGIQVILAAPFLVTHPVNYILGAFNLGRVFLHEWTVNWRFLPEEVFIDKKFHGLLLVLHISLLACFYRTCALHLNSYAKLKAVENDKKLQLKKNASFNMDTSCQLFLFPMFLSNFIGVACSRSLHYQFYIWYFHSLPFLMWSTPYSIPMRLCILGIVEMCWNTYPSTCLSAISLQICHITILYGIYKTQKKLINHVTQTNQLKK